MIPAKWNNYDIHNNDGTVRYTRHADGSVMLPSFIFLATGEEVLEAFYDVIGVAMPARPIGVPSDAFAGQINVPYPRLQVNENGFIQLGDRVRTKNNRDNLVALLESYASATASATRADSTQWNGKIYLPTGQEISDYVYGWAVGAGLPIADTDDPGKVPNVKAEQEGKTTSAKITWDHAEDAGKGVATYKVYSDSSHLGDIASPSDVASFDLSGYGTFLIEVEAVDVDGNVGPRGATNVTLTQLQSSEPPTPSGGNGGTTYWYQLETTDAPSGATGPSFPPSEIYQYDSVVEKWKSIFRVWFTPNGTSWSKPMEFTVGGSLITSSGNTHAAVESGDIPIPYTTAQNPPADQDSEEGDLLVQSFDNGLAYSVRTGAATWTVQFTWEPTAGGIINSLVSPYADPNTWVGTAGLTTHMISNDANGENELLGIVDAALTPHPNASNRFEDVVDSVGSDPEAPEQSEFLVYFAAEGRRLPLPGDVLRYTSPTAKVLTYDIAWNGALIEYRLRTATATGGGIGDRAVLDVTGVGHSLTTLDIGKPLSHESSGEVFDDVTASGDWVGLVTDVPDTDHIEYAPPGSVVQIPEGLLYSDPGTEAGAVFDGEEDFLDVTTPDLQGPFIIRARLKITTGSATATEAIVSKYTISGSNRSIMLARTVDDEIRFIVSDDGTSGGNLVITTSAITPDQWYDIRAEYTPSTHVRIYLDDVLAVEETSGVHASLHNNATIPLRVGVYSHSSGLGSRVFHGEIASVEIDGNVKYDFTRKHGTTVPDESGNGYDLTYQGSDVEAFWANVDWDLATELDGRYAYWDDSLGGYVGQIPVDSSTYATQVIYINSIENNLASVTVLDGE